MNRSWLGEFWNKWQKQKGQRQSKKKADLDHYEERSGKEMKKSKDEGVRRPNKRGGMTKTAKDQTHP